MPPPNQISDTSIIHKTYAFYLTFYKYSQKFPKKDKYTIAQKTEVIILEILELLFLANSKSNKSRLLILNKVDVKLSTTKVLIRLAYDVKAIDQKAYIRLQTQIQEIGKMLGGWIKHTKTK